MKRFVKGLVHGKSSIDNKINFQLWEDKEYNPCINYPGKVNKGLGAKPLKKDKCVTTNSLISNKTFIFQRHAFSCANLSKKKGLYNSITEDEKDPSLNLYGILSILSLKRPSTLFEGKVFVSSLIRTWQTAILEFAHLTDKLEIIISPFIIEGGSGSSNTPLDIRGQIFKMAEFMQLLHEIIEDPKVIESDRDKLIKIVRCDILIQKEGEEVFRHKNFNQTYLPKNGIDETDPSERIKRQTGFFKVPDRHQGKRYADAMFVVEPIRGGAISRNYTFEHNREETDESPFNAEIRELPDKFSYTTYFGELGFGYFYQWVHQFPFQTIFVVCHGNFMRSVIKAYADFPETITKKYFDENAWRFKIAPVEDALQFTLEPQYYTVTLSHGISKPQDTSLMVNEPLCYRPPTERDKAGIKLRTDPYHGQTPTSRYILPSITIEKQLGPAKKTRERPFLKQEWGPTESRDTYKPRVPTESRERTLESRHENPRYASESKETPVLKQEPQTTGPTESSEPPLLRQESQPREPTESRERPEFQPRQSEGTGEYVRPESGIYNMGESTSASPTEFPSSQSCKVDSYKDFYSMFEKKTDDILTFSHQLANLMKSAPEIEIETFVKEFMVKNVELFENHYLCFLLLHLPYFKSIMDKVFNAPNHAIKIALDLFVKPEDLGVVITATNKIYQLAHLKTFQMLLIERCIKNANHIYVRGSFFKYSCHTLLDSLVYRAMYYYSFDPPDKNLETYRPFTNYLKTIYELIKRGARFSENQKIQEMTEPKSYFKKFVFDKLMSIKFYGTRLTSSFIEQFNDTVGGTRRIKGTSSSKTSLRRPLVKRATRRGSLYKGKRRTKVNRR